MVDVGTAISTVLPTKASLFSGLSSALWYGLLFILLVIILGGGGLGVFFLIRYLQFNKKIDIYEWRDGKPEYVGSDRAKEIRYNLYGDTVFYLRKRKKFLPRGEYKIAKNRYMYAIREDGEWVNFSLTDFNSKLRQADVKFIHPDMRAFKSGLSKIMKENFEKKNFLKEWAPILVPIIFFVIVSIALYFVVDKIVASQDNLLQVTKAASDVMDKAGQVLSGLNNVCSSSGYKPVG